MQDYSMISRGSADEAQCGMLRMLNNAQPYGYK